MKSNALGRCRVLSPIAALVASISVSGCLLTTARQATVEIEPPASQSITSDAEADFRRALSLVAEERHAEARTVLDPLLQREPEHSRARVLHGVLRAREGRVGNAIEIFETLTRDYPDMSEPYNNLSVLYAVEGRLDDARRVLLESLERRPSADTYVHLAEVYMKLSQEATRRARELDAGVGSSRNLEGAGVSRVSEMLARSGE